MTTVEGSAMLELFVNPTYVVEVFVQQFAVLETSTFVVAQNHIAFHRTKEFTNGKFGLKECNKIKSWL